MTVVSLDIFDVTGYVPVPLNVLKELAWSLSRTDKDAKTGTITSEYIDELSEKPYQRVMTITHQDAGNGILRNSVRLSYWVLTENSDGDITGAEPATFTIAFNVPTLGLDPVDIGDTLMQAISILFGTYNADTDSVDWVGARKVLAGLTGFYSV